MDTSSIRAFSQRDPRWRDVRLGEGGLTIGQAGCLLCSAAAMLASWGWDTDPVRLNGFLLAHEGYCDGNLLVFGALDGQWCRFLELVRCEKVAAPVERLRNAIAGGAGVLVQVDFTPGGALQQHWVWLTELGERSGHIVDPWQLPGGELVDLGRYLAQGWTPARGIFAAAIYSRLARRRQVDWVGPMEQYQETICCRHENRQPG